MRRKGEIISMMPNRKDGKIDWLSTKDMDIEIICDNCGEEYQGEYTVEDEE